MAEAGAPAELKAQLRLWLGEEIALGPGKADLLAAINEAGSIAAAGRRLSMSYRRAWLLVDTMNRCFREPLVVSVAGGSGGGGAQLTTTGQEVLRLYRALQADVSNVTAGYADRFRPYLRD